jgi:hypothetical protein
MTPILWFYDNRIGIFPLKPREKTPACKSWDDYSCTREQAATFVNYGVRLGPFVVVDSDSTAAESWVATHLPSTPFRVRTARGWHRYYRLLGTIPKLIHRDGLTIECRNHGQYVVGPGSVHPTGFVYVAERWSWRVEDIPFFPSPFQFDDRGVESRGSASGQSFALSEFVEAGERHDEMWKLLRSLMARTVPAEVAISVCQIENLERCRPPIPTNELTTYLRRVSKQPHTMEFGPPLQGWDLVGRLFEVGLSRTSVRIVAKSLDPDFDPDALESPEYDARILRRLGAFR